MLFKSTSRRSSITRRTTHTLYHRCTSIVTIRYTILLLSALTAVLLLCAQISYAPTFLPLTTLYRLNISTLIVHANTGIQLHTTPIYTDYTDAELQSVGELLIDHSTDDGDLVLVQVYNLQQMPLLLHFYCELQHTTARNTYVALAFDTTTFDAIYKAGVPVIQLMQVDNGVDVPLQVNLVTHLSLQYHVNKLVDIALSQQLSVLLTDINVIWFSSPLELIHHQPAQCTLSLYSLSSKLHTQSLIHYSSQFAALHTIQQCLRTAIDFTTTHGTAVNRFAYDEAYNCWYNVPHCALPAEHVVSADMLYRDLIPQRAGLYSSVHAAIFDIHNSSTSDVLQQLTQFDAIKYAEVESNSIQCVNAVTEPPIKVKPTQPILNIYAFVKDQHSAVRSFITDYKHNQQLIAVNLHVTVEYSSQNIFISTINFLQSYAWQHGQLHVYIMDRPIGRTINWLSSIDWTDTADAHVMFLHDRDLQALVDLFDTQKQIDMMQQPQLVGYTVKYDSVACYRQQLDFYKTVFTPGVIQQFVQYATSPSIHARDQFCVYGHDLNSIDDVNDMDELQRGITKYVFDTGSYVANFHSGACDTTGKVTRVLDLFDNVVTSTNQLTHYKTYLPVRHQLNRASPGYRQLPNSTTVTQTSPDMTPGAAEVALHRQYMQLYRKLYGIQTNDDEFMYPHYYYACETRSRADISRYTARLGQTLGHTAEIELNITVTPRHSTLKLPSDLIEYYIAYYTDQMQYIGDFLHTDPTTSIHNDTVRFVVYQPEKAVDWSRHIRGIYFSFLLAVVTHRILLIDLGIYFELYQLPQQFVDHNVKLNLADFVVLFENYNHDTIEFQHSLNELQFHTDLNQFYTSPFLLHTSHVAHDRALCSNTVYEPLCFKYFGLSRMQRVGSITQFLLSAPAPVLLTEVARVQDKLVDPEDDQHKLVLIHANVMPQHYPTAPTAATPLPGITDMYWTCVIGILQHLSYPPHSTSILFLTNKPNDYVQPLVNTKLGRFGVLVYDDVGSVAPLTDHTTGNVLTAGVASDLVYSYVVGEADVTIMTESTYLLFNAARTQFRHSAYAVREGEAERRTKDGVLVAEAEMEYCGTLHRQDMVWTDDVLF